MVSPVDELKCAFCGDTKPFAQTVCGPGVSICCDCVWLCAEVLEERGLSRLPVGHERGWGPIEALADVVCAFCDDPHKRPLVLRNVALCDGCAHAVAQFYLDTPTDIVSAIWGCPLDTIADALRRRERVVVPARDAQAHADLALAYAEMNLAIDALTEASVAILATADEAIVRSALDVLVGELSPAAIETLRRRLLAWVEAEALRGTS